MNAAVLTGRAIPAHKVYTQYGDAPFKAAGEAGYEITAYYVQDGVLSADYEGFLPGDDLLVWNETEQLWM